MPAIKIGSPVVTRDGRRGQVVGLELAEPLARGNRQGNRRPYAVVHFEDGNRSCVWLTDLTAARAA